MTNFNYLGRTGIASIIKAIQFLCRIYTSYQTSIIAYINGSSLTGDQKGDVITWLNAANGVCGLILLMKVNYDH